MTWGFTINADVARLAVEKKIGGEIAYYNLYPAKTRRQGLWAAKRARAVLRRAGLPWRGVVKVIKLATYGEAKAYDEGYDAGAAGKPGGGVAALRESLGIREPEPDPVDDRPRCFSSECSYPLCHHARKDHSGDCGRRRQREAIAARYREIAELQAELGVGDRELTALREYIAELRGEVSRANGAIDDISGERDRWRRDYEALREERDRWKWSYEAIRRESRPHGHGPGGEERGNQPAETIVDPCRPWLGSGLYGSIACEAPAARCGESLPLPPILRADGRASPARRDELLLAAAPAVTDCPPGEGHAADCTYPHCHCAFLCVSTPS